MRSPELKLRERFDTFCSGLAFSYLRWRNFLKALIAKEVICLDEIDHEAKRFLKAFGMTRETFEYHAKKLNVSTVDLRKELGLGAREIEELAKQIVFYPEPFERNCLEAIAMIWRRKRKIRRRISFREAVGTVILLYRAAIEIETKRIRYESSKTQHEFLKFLHSLSRMLCKNCPDRDTCPDRV